MVKPFCDDCGREIPASGEMIQIENISFIAPGPPFPRANRGARMVHFDSLECAKSWLIKSHNRPTIISAGE